MSRIPCYTVGRDLAAAIVLQHETVSRVHAELIPVSDGRIYVTDCASTSGTFIHEGGQWHQLSQDFVSAGERLRFGEVEVSVQHLLTDISRLRVTGNEGGADSSNAEKENQLDASQGVVRDPDTGEPVALAKPD